MFLECKILLFGIIKCELNQKELCKKQQAQTSMGQRKGIVVVFVFFTPLLISFFFSLENITTVVTSTTTAANTVPSVLTTSSERGHDSYLMNQTLREIREEIDDSGRIAGIIIGVLGGLTIVISVVS